MRIALTLLLFLSSGVTLFGQDTSAQPLLSPGGLRSVPPNIDYESVVVRADMTELLALLKDASELHDPELRGEVRFQPDIWAREIRHVRDVWCLQFSFKSVRIIDVDLPNAAGNYDKKKIWYLVYNVKNLGPAELDEKQIKSALVNSALGSAVPAGSEKNLPVPKDRTLNDVERSAPLVVRQQTGIFAPQSGNSDSVRFVPQFILATKEVAYMDSIIPLALLAIQKREGMKAMPETTASIAQKNIKPGEDLWGVAMWTDIDPRINEFSIFVSGLTNAYLWSNKRTDEGEFVNEGKIGEGRIIMRRILKLDWWRVGDANSLNESQIHFGSKDGRIPESIFDRSGKMTPEERKKLKEAKEAAGADDDGWVSPAKKAVYHLMRQDWLKPSFGYEWIFL
jgi:hypothetical protein